MRSLSHDTAHLIANWLKEVGGSMRLANEMIYLISDRLEAASEEDDVPKSDVQLYVRGEEGH